MPLENQEPSVHEIKNPEQLTGNQSFADIPQAPDESVKESAKGFLWETIKIVIICLIIVIPFKQFVLQPFYVKGASMEPNFHDHEYLIINELTYYFNDPARGEIVVFKYPETENTFYIKRVIGLPNERIVISQNKVIIYNQQKPNGFVLTESKYLDDSANTYGEIDIKLKADEYFVMGDNRDSSLDSRKIGPVKRDSIVGKTWLRGWPINKFTFFETPTYN